VALVPTIGVSIAVPEPWGSELQEYRIAMGDEAARHIPTHITLLPPHEVEHDELDAVLAHLDEVASRMQPFRVLLRGTGTFEPVSPVVFVGVVQGISACELLAAEVMQGPLEIERAFPYHPHVTIAHHLPEASLEQAFVELQRFEAAFDVTEMWVYLHDAVSGWQPTRAFALGNGGATRFSPPG
jgi:2'-5' RNA ligase